MKKMLALILAAAVAMSIMICGAAADGEWADYTCQEQNCQRTADIALFIQIQDLCIIHAVAAGSGKIIPFAAGG